mmetsp:Transcript_84678/g.159587  ORF Transcript_84678/g.159587 Transcript_84678/m.159587 type:complete len:206 (+) Transcript_84678:327-944(+)
MSPGLIACFSVMKPSAFAVMFNVGPFVSSGSTTVTLTRVSPFFTLSLTPTLYSCSLIHLPSGAASCSAFTFPPSITSGGSIGRCFPRVQNDSSFSGVLKPTTSPGFILPSASTTDPSTLAGIDIESMPINKLQIGSPLLTTSPGFTLYSPKTPAPVVMRSAPAFKPVPGDNFCCWNTIPYTLGPLQCTVEILPSCPTKSATALSV